MKRSIPIKLLVFVGCMLLAWFLAPSCPAEGFQEASKEIQDFYHLTSTVNAINLISLPNGKVLLIYKDGTRVLTEISKVQSMLISKYRRDLVEVSRSHAEIQLSVAVDAIKTDQVISQGKHF